MINLNLGRLMMFLKFLNRFGCKNTILNCVIHLEALGTHSEAANGKKIDFSFKIREQKAKILMNFQLQTKLKNQSITEVMPFG